MNYEFRLFFSLTKQNKLNSCEDTQNMQYMQAKN